MEMASQVSSAIWPPARSSGGGSAKRKVVEGCGLEPGGPESVIFAAVGCVASEVRLLVADWPQPASTSRCNKISGARYRYGRQEQLARVFRARFMRQLYRIA